MNSELQAVLDSIEADVQRMRIDLPLKTSIIAKLDQARVLARSVALDRMAENAQEIGLGY